MVTTQEKIEMLKQDIKVIQYSRANLKTGDREKLKELGQNEWRLNDTIKYYKKTLRMEDDLARTSAFNHKTKLDFKPIILGLETKEEAEFLWHKLNCRSDWDDYKKKRNYVEPKSKNCGSLGTDMWSSLHDILETRGIDFTKK